MPVQEQFGDKEAHIGSESIADIGQLQLLLGPWRGDEDALEPFLKTIGSAFAMNENCGSFRASAAFLPSLLRSLSASPVKRSPK